MRKKETKMKLPLGSKLFSIQDFNFINFKKKRITIRTLTPVEGGTNNQFIAAPYWPMRLGKKKFHTTGSSKEEALYNCMNLLNDVEDITSIFPLKRQQEDEL